MTYFNVFLRILRLGENTRILPYFITGLNVRNNSAEHSTTYRPITVITFTFAYLRLGICLGLLLCPLSVRKITQTTVDKFLQPFWQKWVLKQEIVD